MCMYVCEWCVLVHEGFFQQKDLHCPLISAWLIYFHLCCILLFLTLQIQWCWEQQLFWIFYDFQCIFVQSIIIVCVCVRAWLYMCMYITLCVCVHMLPPVCIKSRSMWVSFSMIHWLKQREKSLMAGKRVSSLFSHKRHKQVKCNYMKWYAII